MQYSPPAYLTTLCEWPGRSWKQIFKLVGSWRLIRHPGFPYRINIISCWRCVRLSKYSQIPLSQLPCAKTLKSHLYPDGYQHIFNLLSICREGMATILQARTLLEDRRSSYIWCICQQKRNQFHNYCLLWYAASWFRQGLWAASPWKFILYNMWRNAIWHICRKLIPSFL